VTTNPATLLGFGTWVAFGAGRVPVGLSGSDSLFDTLEETGGSKNATLVEHQHTGVTNSAGSHRHYATSSETGGVRQFDTNVNSGNFISAQTGSSGLNESYNLSAVGSDANIGLTSISGEHQHNFTTGFSGTTGNNANLQPYITVAMWKRTA
jgi:hypothetical protein